MTESVHSNGEAEIGSSFPRKMFPEKSSASPYLRRLDNREESIILGTFIQWEDQNMTTKSNRRSTGGLPRNAPSRDVLTEADERKSTSNFIKRNRSDNSEIRCPGEPLRPVSFHSLHEDVHLSRPATPQLLTNTEGKGASTDVDRYRILYLLVRVEQQQEHLRHVLESMRQLGVQETHIRNILNVQNAINKMHGYLIGIRDDDHVITRQIGNRKDIEEFLGTIEQSCSSIEELPVPGSREGKQNNRPDHDKDIGQQKYIPDKKAPVKLRRRKNSPPSIQATRSVAPNGSKEGAVFPSDTAGFMTSTVNQQTKKQASTNKLTAKTSELPDIAGKVTGQSEIKSLMRQIDDLMNESGLIGRTHDNMMSFEVFMLGDGEKKHRNYEKHKHKMDADNTDSFIEELDRLLDDCDA